jgi:exodeoxyribonuclease VII small subunit
MATDGEKPGFENMLRDLEGMVDRLESGSLSLEESLEAFERGVGLVRELTGTLNEVERRVEVLLREDCGGALEVRALDEDDEA